MLTKKTWREERETERDRKTARTRESKSERQRGREGESEGEQERVRETEWETLRESQRELERERGRERGKARKKARVSESRRELEREIGREGERQRGREAPGLLAPLSVCFFVSLPRGLPYENWSSQECCLFYLRSSLLSSDISLFYFCRLFPSLSFSYCHSGLLNYSNYLTFWFCTLTAKGWGLIPQWGNKIHKPHGVQKKKKKERKKKRKTIYTQGSYYLCSDYYLLND